MSSGETLCLRWNEFESSIKQGFSELRSNENFFDVTLACGSDVIRAHRVILSACSSFFRSLLTSIPHSNPYLYLRGIELKHLESILCFMYNGEVRVQHEDLDQFLLVAQELCVNGLVQEDSKISPPKEDEFASPSSFALRDRPSSPLPLASKRIRAPIREPPDDIILETNRGSLDEQPNNDDEDGNYMFINNYDNPGSDAMKNSDILNGSLENKLLDAELMKYISPRGSNSMYNCLKCSYSSLRHLNVKRHIEARHFLTDGFKCSKCSGVFKTRETRSKHFLKQHKGDPVYYSTAHFE
eukprot:TRINITY_DN1709_c0_g1_i5.p1 TRINITY_DN1709_c0_g1~~TRINITY_DN1709_c0_g1_i5.p1  ORF type:complete len:298 (-),score=65.04 TRINITY_DN1709_c0_g1_i5:502-1395(-)